MKRLPLLGFILIAFASCTGTIDSTEQTLACYDTGHGKKCVPLSQVPADTAACLNKDTGTMDPTTGTTKGDADSADTSNSGSDSDGDGNSDSSNDDDSSSPSGSGQSCTTGTPGADTDGDSISDSKDCDCGGTTVPNPTGGGGPIITVN